MPKKTGREAKVKIKQLAAEGFSGTEIYNQLWNLHGEGRLGDHMPSLRTVQDLMRAHVPRDPSGPWGVAAATPDEIRVVLPVAAAAAVSTKGKSRLTNRAAEFVLKVRAADDELSPTDAWLFAQSYVLCEERHYSTEEVDRLDMALAIKPWKHQSLADEYRMIYGLGDGETEVLMTDILPLVALAPIFSIGTDEEGASQ